MFRYHIKIPVELEPEYSEGFTCDHCGKEVMKGPFYHQEKNGTDFCISCGDKQGLTPFNGLIASLFFTDDEKLLSDYKTHSFVLFGFKIDSSTYGFFFDDNSNLIFRITEDGSLYGFLHIANDNGTIMKTSLDNNTSKSRYPWADLGVTRLLPVEVVLHQSPQETIPFGELFISGFSATEKGFSLNLGDGWEQFFNIDQGTETVRKYDYTIMVIPNYYISTIHSRERTEKVF
ncbi:unnamed protein product [Phytomonas sp. Hart1]|nr:unnamed protein product [Phytomonas sp. Hart1]|eukprot:CCW71346.1 unnamed protein product [Phytomonas sp. isolate Hart1]